MKLLEQYSYRTEKSWRPQPVILEEEALQFLGISFTWGEIDLAQKAFENIRIFVEASLNQSEVTNPFGFNEGLSSLENALYSGSALANDVIYRLINNFTFTSGLEGVWMIKKGRELALLQIGQPQVYLVRSNSLTPLLSVADIITSKPTNGQFLPNKLLGIHAQCYVNIQSICIEPGDELLLLAHSLAPASIHQSVSSPARSSPDKDKMLFQKITNEFPHCPFWMSRLQIDREAV